MVIIGIFSGLVIIKKRGENSLGANHSSFEARLVRFFKADYDFKPGNLRKEFLKICFKKKSSSDMDTKEK